MSELLDTIRLVAAAVGALLSVLLAALAARAAAKAARAWLDVWERLEQRRADAARRERDRLDQLATRRTPTAEELHRAHPDIPREEPT